MLHSTLAIADTANLDVIGNADGKTLGSCTVGGDISSSAAAGGRTSTVYPIPDGGMADVAEHRSGIGCLLGDYFASPTVIRPVSG